MKLLLLNIWILVALGLDCTDTTGTHAVGTTWLCPDGCNTCACTETGNIVSTDMACIPAASSGGVTPCSSIDCGPAPGAPNVLCPDGIHFSGPGACERSSAGVCAWQWLSCPTTTPTSCSDSVGVHEDGSTWTCPDGCNSCSCVSGMIISTLRACSEGSCIEYPGGEAHPSGSSWTCRDGCNICSCEAGVLSQTYSFAPCSCASTSDCSCSIAGVTRPSSPEPFRVGCDWWVCSNGVATLVPTPASFSGCCVDGIVYSTSSSVGIIVGAVVSTGTAGSSSTCSCTVQTCTEAGVATATVSPSSCVADPTCTVCSSPCSSTQIQGPDCTCTDAPPDYTYSCSFDGSVTASPGDIATGVVAANGCFDVICTASGTSYVSAEASTCNLYSFDVVINDPAICNNAVLSAALESTGMVVQISSNDQPGCTVVVYSSSSDREQVAGALTSYGVSESAVEEVSCTNCMPSSDSSSAAVFSLF